MLYTKYPAKVTSFIKEKINTGYEYIINDTIHVGIGKHVYMWASDITPEMKEGCDYKKSKNPLFVNLTASGIKKALQEICSEYNGIEGDFWIMDNNEDSQEL